MNTSRARIVVVGGGIMGLSIAYHLAERGQSDVQVLDMGYLCSGASGRNGGGVRAQWSTETNVRLMQESIRMCRAFARKMKINVWFRQGGYLFLARDAVRASALETSARMQQEAGNRTSLLDAAGANKIVPELDTTDVVLATYNPDDGVVFPWPFVWGFARGAEKLGVVIRTFTKVVGIDTGPSGVRAVTVESRSPAGHSLERIETELVINAAGAWAPELARLCDIELPNTPHRHEICSSEPLKPWLKPLVADLEDGLYFSQSTRGEIVGGVGQRDAPDGINQESSHAFLGRYSRALMRNCPSLGRVKILRQWAGCYDITPDSNPIVGPIDELAGFVQASGFMGHGFMMAPVVGRMMAEAIVSGDWPPEFERWNLRRFREGNLLSEAMIIG